MNSTTANNSMNSGVVTSSLLNPDTSALILRVSLGVVLIAHSIYLKMMVFSLAGTAQYFSSIGFPAALAYVVFFVEAIAGVAIIVGYKTRLFSALVIPVLLGATWTHFGNGWLFSNKGGGWEYPLVLTAMAVAQMGLGNGRFSLQKG